MKYRVILTDNAKRNLRSYFLRAADVAPDMAAAWLNRFHKSLQSLGDHPQRCPLAMEDSSVDDEIRQFRFGRRTGCYRVLFTISGEEVLILHIRRAAMDVASPDELLGLDE